MGCDGFEGGRGWRVDGLMGKVGRGCDLRRGVSGRGVGDWVIGKLEGWEEDRRCERRWW